MGGGEWFTWQKICEKRPTNPSKVGDVSPPWGGGCLIGVENSLKWVMSHLFKKGGVILYNIPADIMPIQPVYIYA